jgi:hypothetical protein
MNKRAIIKELWSSLRVRKKMGGGPDRYFHAAPGSFACFRERLSSGAVYLQSVLTANSESIRASKTNLLVRMISNPTLTP